MLARSFYGLSLLIYLLATAINLPDRVTVYLLFFLGIIFIVNFQPSSILQCAQKLKRTTRLRNDDGGW